MVVTSSCSPMSAAAAAPVVGRHPSYFSSPCHCNAKACTSDCRTVAVTVASFIHRPAAWVAGQFPYRLYHHRNVGILNSHGCLR
jgi:hypothetical protein